MLQGGTQGRPGSAAQAGAQRGGEAEGGAVQRRGHAGKGRGPGHEGQGSAGRAGQAVRCACLDVRQLVALDALQVGAAVLAVVVEALLGVVRRGGAGAQDAEGSLGARRLVSGGVFRGAAPRGSVRGQSVRGRLAWRCWAAAGAAGKQGSSSNPRGASAHHSAAQRSAAHLGAGAVGGLIVSLIAQGALPAPPVALQAALVGFLGGALQGAEPRARARVRSAGHGAAWAREHDTHGGRCMSAALPARLRRAS